MIKIKWDNVCKSLLRNGASFLDRKILNVVKTNLKKPSVTISRIVCFFQLRLYEDYKYVN